MSAQPNLIPEPWANQGARIAIPDRTAEAGRASWAAGFPPETSLPLGAGGVPPHWLDFQGVLYALSAHTVFGQTGARYLWQAALDYPVGACIIGSDNTVYQAIQESGPNYAAGAKDPTAAANSGYWQPMVPPDGETIKVIGGKMVAVNQGATAEDLADNLTTVANAGKLSVDLTNATPAALTNISQYLAKSGGGLEMDSATGKLVVSGIMALRPLTANLDVYVDGATGSDTIVDGRGTRELPFATIQACVDYVTGTYYLGRYGVNINIAAGTYRENISLGQYMYSKGIITLKSETIEPPTIISNNCTIRCSYGGRWHLNNLNLVLDCQNLDSAILGYLVLVEERSDLKIKGGSLSASYTGTASMRLLEIFHVEDESFLLLDSTGDDTMSIELTPGQSRGIVLDAIGAEANIVYESVFSCSGDMMVFCSAANGAIVNFADGSFTGAMTGKRYSVAGGSGVHGPRGGFPGSVDGTVETETYCWYRQ